MAAQRSKFNASLGAIIFAPILIGLSSNAAASFVSFDSITGKSYAISGFYTGYLAASNVTGVIGQQFAATASGFIDSISLSAFNVTAPSASIFSDNGGTIGSLIENLALTGSSSYGTYASGAYSSGASLTAGTKYWVVMGRDPQLEYWFYMNGVFTPAATNIYFGQPQGNQFSTVGGSYFTTSATTQLGMRITIAESPTVVPLPPGYAMLVSGLGLLALGARRRKTA